mmetsp:Transcript_4169/g.10474  ORF Transcript_4169/g.10474 Transcript_4169/m.10474 type:complete len:380 (-) Transcript_4169:37-1176(-)
MNPQVFGAEPCDIGIGLIVDGQRLSDHSAPGIEVYDDCGEIEMLGRTAWLEVAFGSGWAVHALANKSLANDHAQGVVLANSGYTMDLDRERCSHRVDTYHSITPGDRVVRVTGHNLRSNDTYLCFDIELHMASGRVIGAAGDNPDWCGDAFEYVCPPGHAVICPTFGGGSCTGLLVMETSLYEPWTPRAHRLLKAPPAARAIVESCHVAKTKGLPADVWCHVLGFLRGFDLLEPVLLRTLKLVDFSAASAFYGSRKGYVFKTGDQGLGYYLDNVDKAKERVLEGLEGPGLFARAPAVDVEAPETAPAPAPAPPPAEPPKKKKRFDFSLPETHLHPVVNLSEMLGSVHPAAREDPESDESEENSYGARSDSFGDYYDADY